MYETEKHKFSIITINIRNFHTSVLENAYDYYCSAYLPCNLRYFIAVKKYLTFKFSNVFIYLIFIASAKSIQSAIGTSSKFLSQVLKNLHSDITGSITSDFSSTDVSKSNGYLQFVQYDDPQCNSSQTSIVVDLALNTCFHYVFAPSIYISYQEGSNIVNLTGFTTSNCTGNSIFPESIPISGTCNSGSTLTLFPDTSSLPPSPFLTNYYSRK